jgi:hypothetical protein
MATLANQKVKDAYTSLLKLESGTATSTTKVIEDGAGNDTALKLSTTTVEVDGTLLFGTSPTSGTTETSALFLDGSGNVVKRTLGSAAFTSGASLSATAPIDITSDVVSLNAPTTLSQITSGTAATADSFFIYDASATAHKYITLDDLKTYVTAGVKAIAAGSNTEIQFNASGILDASPSLIYNGSQLYFDGLEFIVRENSSGDGATFNRSISGDTANGVSNDPFISVSYENFKGMMIDYVIYNVNETRKRIGTFTLIWNSQSISATPTANDSVSLSYGTTTVGNVVLGAAQVGSQIQGVLSNTSGETMYIRGAVRLIYSY